MSVPSIMFQQRIKDLYDELSQLEARAGIAEESQKIEEGCFIPYGIDGEGDDLPKNQQSENYFDTEYDHRRDGIRDLYFGVADVNLRKALIEKVRVTERLLQERAIEERSVAADQLEKAEKALRNPKWTIPLLVVAGAVAWGAYKGGWEGVLIVAGGVAYSYFQRKDSIARLTYDATDAKQAVAAANEAVNERDVRPEYFSLREALTGARDTTLDGVSACHLRALIRGGQTADM